MEITTDTTQPTGAQAAPDPASRAPGGEVKLTQALRWRVPVVAVPHHAAPPRNPSLPTFAGLMTLILTFFIVLTSMSLHDRSKTHAAIASVQAAFGNAGPKEESSEKSEEDIARDFIAGLTSRIQSLVPLMGGKKAPVSDHQVLWLPSELAFVDQSATLTPVFPTVLREVVNALKGVPQRLSPRIEMRLCGTELSETLRARAVAIGAALAGERAPLARFSVGVADCDATRIGIAVALAPAEDAAPAAGVVKP